jgi:FAD/FMN-containing dehydrogenase
MSLIARSLDASMTSITDAALADLRAGVRGSVLAPGDAQYDEARSIWNAMIDRKPSVIVRCSGAADVRHAVRFAAKHSLLVSVRGAGHNIAGKALADGAILIDLSGLRSVHVDPQARIARVCPGATLGDVDHETQAFGLATPTGINSTTGIAGLTLGGGFGWLSRKHGLTVDNLVAAEVVTADGAVVRCSAQQDADLFWAIRGGGGNFGVVTSFEFRLHPVGPEVLSGPIVLPFERAPQLLRQYRDFCRTCPEELTVWAVLRGAPPLPFLAPEVHGKPVVILASLYNGPMDEGARAIDALRARIGQPIADAVGPHPFAGFQQAFDPLLTPGARNYWKSHNFSELSDGAIDKVVEYAARLPSAASEIFLAQLGGATNRVASDATAYPHRDTEFVLNVHTRWEDAGADATCIRWAREFYDATLPFATGGVYVNFLSEGEEDRLAGAYGPNLERLARVKAKYDPSNLFRVNQNIRPG